MGAIKALKLKDYATLFGTFCGLLGLFILLIYKDPRFAAWMVFFSLFADMLDGFIARKTNTFNELGKQLDSLSDAISFGITPAIIAFIICTTPDLLPFGVGDTLKLVNPLIMLVPTFLFIAGAVVRLAWFNIRDGGGFEGIPTPLSALTLASTILLNLYSLHMTGGHLIWLNYVLIYYIPLEMVLLAYLNVSTRVIYEKRTDWSKNHNKIKFMTPVTIIIIFTILAIFMPDQRSIFFFSLVLTGWLAFNYLIGLGFYNYSKSKKTEKTEEN